MSEEVEILRAVTKAWGFEWHLDMMAEDDRDGTWIYMNPHDLNGDEWLADNMINAGPLLTMIKHAIAALGDAELSVRLESERWHVSVSGSIELEAENESLVLALCEVLCDIKSPDDAGGCPECGSEPQSNIDCLTCMAEEAM